MGLRARGAAATLLDYGLAPRKVPAPKQKSRIKGAPALAVPATTPKA